jgi:hypothetical protein
MGSAFGTAAGRHGRPDRITAPSGRRRRCIIRPGSHAAHGTVGGLVGCSRVGGTVGVPGVGCPSRELPPVDSESSAQLEEHVPVSVGRPYRWVGLHGPVARRCIARSVSCAGPRWPRLGRVRVTRRRRDSEAEPEACPSPKPSRSALARAFCSPLPVPLSYASSPSPWLSRRFSSRHPSSHPGPLDLGRLPIRNPSFIPPPPPPFRSLAFQPADAPDQPLPAEYSVADQQVPLFGTSRRPLPTALL